jgi:hypothetical protein
MKFATGREAKRHEKMHRDGSLGLEGTTADSGVGQEDEVRESVSKGVGVTVGGNDGVGGVELDGGVGEVQNLSEVRREMGSNEEGGTGDGGAQQGGEVREEGQSGEGPVQSFVMTNVGEVMKVTESNDGVGEMGEDGEVTGGLGKTSGVRSDASVVGQVCKGRKTRTYKRHAKQGGGVRSRKRRQLNKETGGNVRKQDRVEEEGEEMRVANEEELNNEMEQNSEMEQNNEITSDDEERPHVGQVHESRESREMEETQTVVKVNNEGSRAKKGRQAKRVVEPSNTARQIVTQVGEKRKGRPDVQSLGGKRKDTEGRNKQKKVVDRSETAARDVIARQEIETRKNDVRVQNKRRVVRAVGNTNITTVRNVGATSDLLITKVIRAKNDGGARKDEKSRENSGTRMSAEQRNEGDVTSNTTEIARKDVAAHNNSDSREDAGSAHIGEERDNSNTTHVDIRNGDVRKSQEGGGKTLTDTSRNNEASNEAIRKILEGKPFVCPECGKGHASRNGLKHHYKTHQNGSENKTHLYYCHECKEGFKTKRKFWLHDVKVHGLIETSSEESDSEMVAGHEERSTRVNMTDTRTDVKSGGDIRGDRMATSSTSGDRRDDLDIPGIAEGDLRTDGDDPVIDVDYVDGRKVVQRKITDWFR